MPEHTTSLPLPPGSSGLPLLGETLAFGRNGFRFVEERVRRFGNVFRTHLLGEPAVVFAGLAANDAWTNPELIERDRSMPAHVEALFGGRSLPLLDGEVHRSRKVQVLAAFDRAAVSGYVPAIRARITAALSRWATLPEVQLIPQLQDLALASICGDVCSLGPGAELSALRSDYDVCSKGFSAIPLNLPGLPLRRALRARDRIFAVLARHVAEHRRGGFQDGLARMLEPHGDSQGSMTDAEAVLELHHVVVAGFIIFAAFAELLVRLAADTGLVDRLRAELRKLPLNAPLDLETLKRAPLVLGTVLEAKRTTRILPAIFGRARRDFTFQGHRIPRGWRVMWAIRASHLDPSLYPEPSRFEPERYLPPREEHRRAPNAYAPQGPGPALGHRCPGIDYATLAMALFVAELVRGYTVELPPQNLDLDFAATPPVPRDGLRARIRKRSTS